MSDTDALSGANFLMERMMRTILITDPEQKARIAECILTALPEWFGLPDSLRTYVEDSKEMPFIATFEHDVPVGFIALKATSPYAAEIYVMGVCKEHHRKGIGRALYKQFESLARRSGFTYVQVKTVQSGIYATYDVTNRFYQSMGFRELECFPDMWDPWNPCQIFIKYIDATDP